MSGAVLYIRVLTPEQADQAHHLPTQKREVEERCKREGGEHKNSDLPLYSFEVIHVGSSVLRTRFNA